MPICPFYSYATDLQSYSRGMIDSKSRLYPAPYMPLPAERSSGFL